MFDFGYYSAMGQNSISKLEAMERGNTTWHFNDDVFSAIDTRKEPLADIWTLYVDRARQIRETYDYIVLMHGGGADSTNILDAFLYADCRPDEICTCWDYPTTGVADSHHNAEIVRVVIPEKARFEKLGIKHRLIDLVPIEYDIFRKTKSDYVYFMNYHLSLNNIAKHVLRQYVREWKDIIHSGRKLVLVWGAEKPHLQYDQGKHWLYFIDNVDGAGVGMYTYMNRDAGWYDELFYWTPKAPLIPIKQAHIVARFCTTVNDPVHYSDRDFFAGYNPNLNKYLKYDVLKWLIYPKWDPTTFCNGKSLSFIYSARDEYFLNGNVLVEDFHAVVDNYFKKLRDETPQNQRYVMKPMHSRRYEIC